MRIASGRTDAKLAFVAVDSTDLKTRETGLSSFTVYRSRNGGTATAYTTPTVTELSAANMPGVYVLTIDEDTTITSGVDEEEYVVHITQAAMAPVTRAVELFRPKATEGSTLDVTATGAAGVDWGNVENPTTAVNLSGTNIDVDQVVASVSGAVASVTGNVGGNVTGSVGSVATGGIAAASFAAGAIDAAALAADAAAEIADAVLDEDMTGHQTQGTLGQAIGDPVADTNTIYKAVVTDATGATVGIDVVAVKTETATIQSDTNDIQTRLPAALVSGRMDSSVGAMAADTVTASALAADAGAEIADAVWDEALAGHLGAGSTGAALNGAGSAGDPWGTALPGAYGAGTAGKIVGDALDAAVSSRATQASVDTVDDFLDTEIAAIKAKTDSLTFTGSAVQADTRAINGVVDAAARASIDALTVVSGIVGNGSTTTVIVLGVMSPIPTVTDQFRDRMLTFAADTPGRPELAGQSRRIVSSTFDGVFGGTVTVDEAFTAAPLATDTCAIRDGSKRQSGDSFSRLGAPAGASVSADVAAIDDLVDTEVGAIKAKTDLLTFSGSAVQSDIRAVNGVVDAAPRLSIQALTTISGIVGNGSTTTVIVLGIMSPVPTETNQFRDRLLTFTADTPGQPKLAGQSRRIVSSTFDGVFGGTVTVDEAFTDAPLATDACAISDGSKRQSGDGFTRLGAPAGASVAADVAAVKADSAAVKAKTDQLAFAGGLVTSDAKAIDGSVQAAQNLELGLSVIGVGAAQAGSTDVSIITGGFLTPAPIDVDQFKGLVVRFSDQCATTALRGQGTRITASGIDGVLTVEKLTRAPGVGDVFTIN